MEFDSETDITSFFQQATMDQIREALLASGVTQEQLDLVDDETLRAFFDGSLEEAIENGTIEDFLSEEE
jgi:hypothetical protein